MKYASYLRNHAVYPGREKALHDFLNATLDRNGKKEKHKLRHCCSSNSEDALTWSCFDVLRQQPREKIVLPLFGHCPNGQAVIKCPFARH
jgi:hypothetical protein